MGRLSLSVKLLASMYRNQLPPPIYKYLNISVIKSLTVKLLPLDENFYYSNFATYQSNKKQ